MNERPNYYLLLELDPAVGDLAVITRVIQDKKALWSRDSVGGNPAAVRKAEANLRRLGDIQRVMTDPKARGLEAAQARILLQKERQADLSKLDELVAVLRADPKRGCTGEDIAKIGKTLGGKISEEDIVARLRAAGIALVKEPTIRAKVPELGPERLDQIRESLKLVGAKDLYDFLVMKRSSSWRALRDRADEINKELIRLGKHDPDSNARKELCGACLALFRSEDEKLRYDNALVSDLMKGLHPQIEFAGRDGILSAEALDVLLRQARDRDVSLEDARAYLQDFAMQRKWRVLSQVIANPVTRPGPWDPVVDSSDSTLTFNPDGQPNQRKLVEDVERLVRERKLRAALEALEKLRHASGPAGTEQIGREIVEGLGRARTLEREGDSLKRKGSNEDAAEKYQEALAVAADLESARAAIAELPPPPASHLVATPISKGFRLNWRPSPGRGAIRYRVARKLASQPLDSRNGTVGTVSATQLDDTTPPVGRLIYYEVVAEREGVCSRQQAVVGPLLLMSEVIGPQLTAADREVTLRWQKPPGCLRVDVWRTTGGPPGRAGEGMRLQTLGDTLHDSGLRNGESYGYRLVAVYRDPARPNQELFTSGVALVGTPAPPLVPVLDLKARRKGAIVSLSWTSIFSSGAAVQIRHAANLPGPTPGSIVSLADIGQFGDVVTSLGSDSAEWPVDRQGQVVFTPLSIRGSNAVVGRPKVLAIKPKTNFGNWIVIAVVGLALGIKGYSYLSERLESTKEAAQAEAAAILNAIIGSSANKTISSAHGPIMKLSPIDGKYTIKETDGVVSYPLPWYDGIDIVIISSNNWTRDNLVIAYLRDKSGTLTRLDGTSPPIHAINKASPIRLTPDHAWSYLRFFTFFVRDTEGRPFLILEQSSSKFLPKSPDQRTAKAIRENTKPILCKQSRMANVVSECSASIYFSNMIASAEFRVHSNGMVNMVNDTPKATDLSSKIEAPLK